jgi:hypothetical protein
MPTTTSRSPQVLASAFSMIPREVTPAEARVLLEQQIVRDKRYVYRLGVIILVGALAGIVRIAVGIDDAEFAAVTSPMAGILCMCVVGLVVVLMIIKGIRQAENATERLETGMY